MKIFGERSLEATSYCFDDVNRLLLSSRSSDDEQARGMHLFNARSNFAISKRPSPDKVLSQTRSDLTRILEMLPEIQAELREHRRLLDILTARQMPDAVRQGENGSRR
jgi:hypothetical protein